MPVDVEPTNPYRLPTGPLADRAGRVIGINSMVANELGLAIPSDAVAAFLAAGDRMCSRHDSVVARRRST